MEVENYIEEFIVAVQEVYPELDMKYQYDDIINEYEISYNTSDFDYEIDGFESTIESKANKLLINNGVYNFYFGDEYYPYK